ncbi:MAG: carboxypeptidase-like regulatory domain-containing protein, partial [Flavobacteriaceae bacterium]|nr:carboxypeptidase-like regulatory domain-containing protein [Flavobacteriaceae bacterium]
QENIVGKVIDENTSKPLVYAFVRFQNSDFGTTTDYKGEFVLNYNKESNSLLVSHIGYKSELVSIGENNDYTICLQQESVELDEVMISSMTGKEVMSIFFDNIKKNHLAKTEAHQGYINYITFNKENCVAQGDATYIYRNGLIDHRTHQNIYDYEKYGEFTEKVGRRNIYKIPFVAEKNIEEINFLDISGYMKFIDSDSNLKFRKDGEIVYNNRSNHVVLFEFLIENKIVFEGRILIDKINFGCSSYSYSFSKNVDPDVYFPLLEHGVYRISKYEILDFTREVKADFVFNNKYWRLNKGQIKTSIKMNKKSEKINFNFIQNYSLDKNIFKDKKNLISKDSLDNEFVEGEYRLRDTKKRVECIKYLERKGGRIRQWVSKKIIDNGSYIINGD